MAEIGCNWARIGPSMSSQSLSIAHKWAVEIVGGPYCVLHILHKYIWAFPAQSDGSNTSIGARFGRRNQAIEVTQGQLRRNLPAGVTPQLNEDEGWNRIEEYVQYQDITWEEPAPMNISYISEVIKPTFEGRLKSAQEQLSYLTTPIRRKTLRNPYLICEICGGAHEADECDSDEPREQVCLSGGDIYDDPSLLRFYQNDDIPPWENLRQRKEGEEGPEWVVRRNFENKFSNFMLEKNLHAKGL
ncbi:hypothetical protein Tco_0734254 [Tanacetum coccineum]